MDYNARMYSPSLGRFIQPDTIVPDMYNPQSLNRYSYVMNNPIRYTDPTGHCYAVGGNSVWIPDGNDGPCNWLKNDMPKPQGGGGGGGQCGQSGIVDCPASEPPNACYRNIPCVDIPDGLTLHPDDIFFPTLIGQTPIYSEDNLPIGYVNSYYYPNWENSNWSWNWEASGAISDWRGQGAAVAAGFVDLGLASAGITVTVGSITIPLAATGVGMVLVVDLANQSVTIESGYIVHTDVIPLYNGPSPQQLIEDTFNPFPLP